MKTKLKNSSKIAKAFNDTEEKFCAIGNLVKEFEKANEERQKVLKEIVRVYKIVFTNFSSKRIFLGPFNGEQYYFSKLGITKRRDIDKIYIPISRREFDKEAIFVGKHLDVFARSLKTIQKKRKLLGFFKKYKLLEEEPSALIQLKKPVVLNQISYEFKEQKAEEYKPKVFNQVALASVNINSSTNGINIVSFNIMHDRVLIEQVDVAILNNNAKKYGLHNKIYIEQIFSYIKEILEKEIKNKQKETKRFKMFYEDIKQKFGDFIMLNKIEEGDNE